MIELLRYLKKPYLLWQYISCDFQQENTKIRRRFSMTNVGDVIRQVETTLNDIQYPPTLEQREILSTILYKVSLESVESQGSGYHDRIRSF
jgi:hypothetical protein